MSGLPPCLPECFYCGKILNGLSFDTDALLYGGKVTCRPCWLYAINHFEN